MSEKEFYIWLGQRIKEMREQKHIQQQEIVEKTGIAQGMLSKFENNGKKISAYRLKQIIEAIGTPMSEVFDEKKKDISIILPDISNFVKNFRSKRLFLTTL